MDQHAYDAAKAAYQQGEWARAASLLSNVKQTGELNGAADHLLGNSLMKLGMFQEAANAYAEALCDPNYGHVGALFTNQGRALLAAGQPEKAIESLQHALADPAYENPYKAFMCLGNAFLKLGNYQEAGAAFRNAAVDETNPNPATSLINLGDCFLKMGRPLDGVEAYRTALDFSTALVSQNEIYAKLGSAYVAANRMPEAADAFNHAVADGTYILSAEEQASFEAAKKACQIIVGSGPSETDQMLAQAGYVGTGSFDPLDPMGQSGEIMPSPDDTGFFTISESDLVDQGKDKKRKRKKGIGGKIALVLVVILLLLGAIGGFAYYKGYGWPTQQAVVQGIFDAKTNNGDMGGYIAGSVPASVRQQIEANIPSGATVTVDGIDQDMTSSTLRVTAKLPQGGSQIYTVKMVRDGLSFKIVSIDPVYPSMTSTSNAATSSTSDQDSAAVTDVSDTQSSTSDKDSQSKDSSSDKSSSDKSSSDKDSDKNSSDKSSSKSSDKNSSSSSSSQGSSSSSSSSN